MNFTYRKTEYSVTSVREIDDSMARFRAALIASGKEPRVYYASKVKGRGKTSSRRSGVFYRNYEGSFLKI